MYCLRLALPPLLGLPLAGDPTGPPGAAAAPPSVEETAGVDREPSARPEEVVVESALSEGPIHSATSGYLYFPFKGKTKSIRSMELLYRGPAGTLTVRLL